MAFKPIDNKRDQFRKYLEATGVIEVLSKSITKLMESPEKPESPVAFIRQNMGLTQKELDEIEFLKEEVESYKKQVKDLKNEIAGLKSERQDIKDNISNEVVADASVKDEMISEISAEKQTDGESKKIEDVQPTQVSAKVVDDDQKVDVSNDSKADVSTVVDATDAKIEPIESKPEEIKTDDKSAVGAATPTDK
ncbi:c-Myc-binding protein [Pseudolycoriella hygida]|uniref:c-Myc-binding protein n=1 Tax=Pseudolycoriella hygida TaxID=35572 RepID=A0A9Q0S018_9DIPT|nr:c-Myc-binding protein [Pseudolycoriella hygida]